MSSLLAMPPSVPQSSTMDTCCPFARLKIATGRRWRPDSRPAIHAKDNGGACRRPPAPPASRATLTKDGVGREIKLGSARIPLLLASSSDVGPPFASSDTSFRTRSPRCSQHVQAAHANMCEMRRAGPHVRFHRHREMVLLSLSFPPPPCVSLSPSSHLSP